MTKAVKIASGLVGGAVTISGVSVVAITKSQSAEDKQNITLTSKELAGKSLEFEKIDGFKDDGYWKWNYSYLQETAQRLKQDQKNLKESWTAFKEWCHASLRSTSEIDSFELERVQEKFNDVDDASICFASKDLVKEAPWNDKEEDAIKQEVKDRLDKKVQS